MGIALTREGKVPGGTIGSAGSVWLSAGYRKVKTTEKDWNHMKKVIPVIIAIVLILIIGGITVGKVLFDKYSYSKERADLNAYFGVTDGELAIILQDEQIAEKALMLDGRCYFDLDTVTSRFNDGFYADWQEDLLLYTTAAEVISIPFDSSTVSVRTEIGGTPVTEELDYTAVRELDGRLYLAADYVKRYTNYSVEVFERQVQVYTQWGSRITDTVLKNTAVRERGGIKSPILCDLTAGDEVEVLESMETWSKVKTGDAIIGYVENKLLAGVSSGQPVTVEETPVTDYTEPEYTKAAYEGKVSLGWHSIGGVGGNITLKDMVSGAEGLNVIAPTWFSLSDEAGGFRSFADSSYVQQAHGMGLEVWGVWDDFNYGLETGNTISVQKVLSYTSVRQKLVADIVAAAIELELDGVNIDFERISEETGRHFAQFLRELSVECRENGLTLSIDNYVPYDFRDYYRLDVQGKVADYVIIMGYDEHWHGSGDPGSVASIDYVSGGIKKALEDVPAEKLINALPFYTILWKTEGTKVTDEYVTLRNTADFLGRIKVEPEWDEETCQNYIEWTSGKTTYQMWIEDEESIAAKLSVMSANKLAGVAVWRLGYGTDSVWTLIRGYLSQ